MVLTYKNKMSLFHKKKKGVICVLYVQCTYIRIYKRIV